MAYVKDPNSDEWYEVPDEPFQEPTTPPLSPKWEDDAKNEATNPFPPTTTTTTTTPPRRNPQGNPPYAAGPGETWTWDPDWNDGRGGLGGWFISGGVIDRGPQPKTTGAPAGGGYDGASAFSGQYGFPQLSLPRMQAPPEFSYADFVMGDKFAAPDPSEIEKDPSYQWRFNEGQRAVKTSKAAQGVFGTGATLKALAGYGQNMAKTEYGDIYNRAADTFDRNLSGRFGEWNANRSNKLDAYKTNWGVKSDIYDRDVNATNLEFAPKAKWAELQFGRDWDLYKYSNDDAFRKWRAQGDWASAGSQPVD